MAAKKSRKKAPRVDLVHRVHGECQLIEARNTDSNQAVLAVRFPDKTERLLLADAKFWITPAQQLTAIPVTQPAVADEPESVEPVIDDDTEAELQIEDAVV
jgi:hypothetical protein